MGLLHWQSPQVYNNLFLFSPLPYPCPASAWRKVAPIPNWSKVVRSITLFTTVYSTRDYSIINVRSITLFTTVYSTTDRDYSIINWSKGLFNYIPISLYIPNNPNWSKVAPIGVRLLQFAPKHYSSIRFLTYIQRVM